MKIEQVFEYLHVATLSVKDMQCIGKIPNVQCNARDRSIHNVHQVRHWNELRDTLRKKHVHEVPKTPKRNKCDYKTTLPSM